MRTVTVYESLQELMDAYESGKLSRERYLVLEFDGNTYYLSGGDAEDRIDLEQGEPLVLEDILEEAFGMLGIPIHIT